MMLHILPVAAFAALAAATPVVDRAPTTTTQTVSSCPAYTSNPTVTYVPKAPTKCKNLSSGGVTYKFYSEKCYLQVAGEDGDPIDRGEFYRDLTLDQVCVAAERCAQYAADPSGPGYAGGGTDYSFAIYYSGPTTNSGGGWECYTYYGEPDYPASGYKPPLTQFNGGTDSFAWYQVSPK